MAKIESYERLKHFRKNVLKISQGDFSKRINISRSTLANIEVGNIRLTDRVVSDIQRVFLLRREWLLSGEEPMQDVPADTDSLTNEIVRLYETLTPDNKKYLYGYMQRLLEEQNQSRERMTVEEAEEIYKNSLSNARKAEPSALSTTEGIQKIG